MVRRCEACPERVAAVCRHAFGSYWGGKSRNGEGCDRPLDGVAEAWYARGWTPAAPQPREKACRSVPLAEGMIALAVPSDASAGLSRASCAVSRGMPRRPSHPKVSESILRAADLFFGRGA